MWLESGPVAASPSPELGASQDIDAVVGYLTGQAAPDPPRGESEELSPWDVDGSGIVDVTDADLIRTSLAKDGPSIEADSDDVRRLDVNRDGYVSHLDLLQVLNQLQTLPPTALADT